MATDGALLQFGDMVVVFDGGETQNQLLTQRSALAEKETRRSQLVLELAERERNERLTTEERRANFDKAQRKATQPETLVRRVDYRKLVIERTEAEELMVLAAERERLAAEQRRQELRLVDSEIALSQHKIEKLQSSLAALRVTASRAGLLTHRSSWDGEKFAVGSRVFRGQAVAEIPDMDTLAVRTQVDERDLTRVAVGMRARVVAEGSGIVLDGHIADVGRVVRSKSRVQPVPVVDLRVELERADPRLKPGQGVRVEISGIGTEVGQP
jgi:multidrug resistance efflux pump